MRWISILFWLLLILYLGLVVYLNRALFFSTFDEVYWKDKYEHSQWKLPLSQRTLGDDGLYLYEGYRLIRGADPTTLNAEVPPLAKYLIGASIVTFGNGYVYGFITTTAALLLFFVLSQLLTKNVLLSFVATALVALDPLIAKQFTLTMLDGLQLVFLLLSLLCTLAFVRTKQSLKSLLWAIGAGASVGFFAEVKFPVFAPVIAIVLLVTIWKAKNNLTHIATFLLSAAVAYLIPYLPYFYQGHTFAQWISVQKWIVMFFAKSGLTPTVGSAAATLLFNRNQNLFTREFLSVPEWSPAWPVITGIGIFGLIHTYRSGAKRLTYAPVAAITVLLLSFNLIIPFWTRYLVSVLPFLYLGTILALSKSPATLRIVLIVLLLLANTTRITGAIVPSPQPMVNQFLIDWKHGFFRDMYEATAAESKREMTRDAFYTFGRRVWYDAEIEEAEPIIEPYRWHPFTSPQFVPVRITYKTRSLGSFTTRAIVPVVREQGAWRVAWNWNLVLPDLTPSSHLDTQVEPARRGTLFAADGTPLAQDRESILVWLDPTRVDKKTEEKLFAALETLFEKKIKAVHFHERYVRLGELGLPMAMGVVMHPVDTESRTFLNNFPALTTTPAFGRFTILSDTYSIGTVGNTLFDECCSLLYTTTSYDGMSGLENTYNSVLKGENGGSLVLKDGNGEIVQTFIDKKKQDGKNVRLTQ